MAVRSSDATPAESAPRPRLLGNLLIVASLLLIGAALAIAATMHRGTVVTPPSLVAELTPTPAQDDDGDGDRAAASRSFWPAAIQPAAMLATPTPGPTPAAAGEAQVEVPAPTATPAPKRPAPEHIRIPSVGIDTPVVEVGYEIVALGEQRVLQWEVAEYAAGHHNLSANPGEGGNIVITGHNDWMGEVFRALEHVRLGDEVLLTTAEGEHRYLIEEIHFRREVGVSLDERLATGAFLAPMDEERLTLVTCWPYNVNDHRVIVVARPAND